MDKFNTTEDRAAAYGLLSRCYHPPDERLLDDLRAPDAGCLGAGTLPALADLRKDHAQLFVGPFEVSAPPYGSVYLESDGRVCGDSTMDVVGRYAHEGLRLTLREPADHVAIELEYMHVLICRQTAATAALADAYIEKQRDFLRTHLGVWMPVLAERIVANARTDFYRHVAKATDALVKCDIECCPSRIPPFVCSGSV